MLLILLVVLCASTAFAGSELTTVLPWNEPFNPQYFSINKETGTVYQLEGGIAYGPTRVLPSPGQRNNGLPPVLPSGRPRTENYWSSPDMAIDLNQQLDRDLNRMLGLPD